jgi:pimeloyl-ACP methyl ester carboxylesterase
MATFLLVHGAWEGSWQWRKLTPLLWSAGHEVFAPTLTGLGERAHLLNPTVDLATHIQDIVAVLEYEELSDTVLVGYSYGGMVATGVAERAPERIAQLVYLDALVPRDGQSVLDLFGSPISSQLEQRAQDLGDGWRLPPDPTDKRDEWRLVDQPFKTFRQRVVVKNPHAAALPRTFIYCTEDARDLGPLAAPIAQAAANARDMDWQYYELPTGHMPMQTMPQALAQVLLKIAGLASGRAL